jgi:hypothetical protein
LDQTALFAVPFFDNWSAVASFEDRRPEIETEVGSLFASPVAVRAVLIEDWEDIGEEIWGLDFGRCKFRWGLSDERIGREGQDRTR